MDKIGKKLMRYYSHIPQGTEVTLVAMANSPGTGCWMNRKHDSNLSMLRLKQ